ncbi:uncharacterized protein LOC144509131 isoform X4 [Mustelus asterias]
MDTSEELPKKVFKARKTMRASDRQQLEAIYKSRGELLKANEETKTKLCNGRHENGDCDNKASLNTNCMDDADIDSINDVRLGPEELQGNAIDELSITQTPELNFAEKCLDENKDLTSQDEKMDSTAPVAKDEPISTGNTGNQILADVESKRDDTVESESVELKQDSLIADKSCSDSQSLSDKERPPSVGDSRSQEIPDESSLKLQSSSSSVREKEDHESSLDISEEAITSSIESVQEKNDCESSKMECAETESEIATKDKLGENKSAENNQLEIEEIIPILEKLAPEKDKELSCNQGIVPVVDSPAPKDSPLKDLQEEQMDTSPCSSPTKEECNGNLPEEAFLVLSDEDEPIIENKTENEELVPKNDVPDTDHKEQASDTRQKQEPNEIVPRKRSKSEDAECSISKRCRFSEDEYEAALKVKITARGEIRQTLEKIVQQIIEERISSMQSAVFDKKLAELKNRVEKIECNTRHESLISGLQAKLVQIEKRLGSANQARNDSASKKVQEILAPFQPELKFGLSNRKEFKLAKKNETHQFGKPMVEMEQVPLQLNETLSPTVPTSALHNRQIALQDNRSGKPLIKQKVPLPDCRVSAELGKAVTLEQHITPLSIKQKLITDKQQAVLINNHGHYNSFRDIIVKEHEAALKISRTSKSTFVQLTTEKPQADNSILVRQRSLLSLEHNGPCSISRKSDTDQPHTILLEERIPSVLDQPDLSKPHVILQENKIRCNKRISGNQHAVLLESRAPFNTCAEPSVEPQDNRTPKGNYEPVPDNRKRIIIPDNTMPYNTRRATAWGIRAWDEWARNRNNYFMENNVEFCEPSLYVPVLSHEITHNQLNFWLCHFVEEVRRRDGSFYPPNSLRLLCCSILRYLRETCQRLDIDFFNEYNMEYAAFRSILDRRMRKLKQQGIGIVRKQAQPYSEKEEEKLWQIVFQLRDARSYSYAVYFYLCKVFGVHAAAEHNKLMVDQFSFGADEIGEYLEFVAKSYRDGIQRAKGHTRQYADLSNPRCIVSLFRRYLSMVPRDGPFYRRPLPGRLGFCQQAIGVHTLERYSKEICEAGGISGRHTGQSGRVSSVAALHSRGFDEELIKERMGNGSNAMMSYKKTEMKAVSDCLQPPNPLKKIATCSRSSSSLRQQSVCAHKTVTIAPRRKLKLQTKKN